MFTGIIEEKGAIQEIRPTQQAMQLKITARHILNDIRLGDSIAVNGVCLTVNAFTKTDFVADVMPETLKSTSLQNLKKGAIVNLERAMSMNDRFGGHIVSGHVDCTATIQKITPIANAVYIDLHIPIDFAKQCIEKGSITVDGTSLTIFRISKNIITLSLIPHTFAETIIHTKKRGDIVNIEIDLFSKYVRHHLQSLSQEKLSFETLQNAGF